MLTNDQLIFELKKLHRDELQLVVRSLELFNEVFRRDLHLKMSCPSLYKFAEDVIGYEKDMAYRRIRAAEVLRLAPEFAEHLRARRVAMTTLHKAQVAFRSENARRRNLKLPKLTAEEKRDILNKLLDKSTRQAERLLAETFPHIQPNEERLKQLGGGRVLVSAVMTEDEYKEFLAYKDEISHANPENLNGKVIVHAIKNARPKPRAPKEPGFAAPREGRTPHSAETKRTLHTKAAHQCQHVSKDGVRCPCTQRLQIDHIVPLAFGGTNEITNLRILCAEHNRFAAREAGLHPPPELRPQ